MNRRFRNMTHSKRSFLTSGSLMCALVLVMVFTGIAAAQDSSTGEGMPVLSLQACIRLAMEDSPTLLISEERETIASQAIKDAYGNFLPSLDLTRSYVKSKRTDFDIEEIEHHAPHEVLTVADESIYFGNSNPTGNLIDETQKTNSGDWGARVNMNVFSGFSKYSEMSSAKHMLASAKDTKNYTRETVTEEVTTNYLNLIRYQKLMEVAKETRDQAARELERTETYFRLGSAAKSDVLQQKVRLENTKLELVIARNSVEKAFADLAYVMNRPLAARFEVDRSILATDFVIEDLTEMYAEALGRRLDLSSRQHAVEARGSDVTTASSSVFPRVDLFVNYGRSNNESPYRFGAQESQNTTYGYQVSWAVFDKLRTWTGRSRAKANARIAQYELDQARMNAQVEIRQLHNIMVEAHERYLVSKETIKQSQEELRLAQERFRVGAGTTLDVIVAQTNLATSRGQEVQAICDFIIGEAKMNRALGRINE